MTGEQDRAMAVMEELVTAQAVAAAARTGLLETLSNSAVTFNTLCDEHDFDRHMLRRVLDVLNAAGLVSEANGTLRVSEDLRRFDREMPRAFSSVADSMADLPRFLRLGRGGIGQTHQTDYVHSVDRLRPIFSEAAEELARRLEPPIDSVLDLGAGSGVFGIAVAQEHGASKLTGFDHPSVIPVFRRFAVEADLAAAVDDVGGDFLTDELPVGYDCTLICNVLRILSAAGARTLIQRAMSTLSDDGRLVIVDVMGKDPPDYALRRSIYRLDLALRSDSSGPHDDAAIRDWIIEAGGVIDRRLRLETAPLAEEVLLVRRRAPEHHPAPEMGAPRADRTADASAGQIERARAHNAHHRSGGRSPREPRHANERGVIHRDRLRGASLLF